MDRHHIVYLLIVLLCILLGVTYVCLAHRSRERTRQRQQRDERQAARERLAAKRIAENGGQPLSAHLATSDASRHESERSL